MSNITQFNRSMVLNVKAIREFENLDAFLDEAHEPGNPVLRVLLNNCKVDLTKPFLVDMELGQIAPYENRGVLVANPPIPERMRYAVYVVSQASSFPIKPICPDVALRNMDGANVMKFLDGEEEFAKSKLEEWFKDEGLEILDVVWWLNTKCQVVGSTSPLWSYVFVANTLMTYLFEEFVAAVESEYEGDVPEDTKVACLFTYIGTAGEAYKIIKGEREDE